MTVWRPASHEIDPVLEAVAAAARATILPVATIDTPPASADGIREVPLADGRRLRMVLSARELSQESRGGRAVIVYAVLGNAVIDRAGYSISGQAVVDVATRAFLDVDCRLESVGTVAS